MLKVGVLANFEQLECVRGWSSLSQGEQRIGAPERDEQTSNAANKGIQPRLTSRNMAL